MARNILHLDIRHFCIALERQRQPELRGWPLVIAAGQGRTVVQAVSAEAHREGIHPGMAVGRARGRCRRLVILPPDFSLYRRVQKQITARLNAFSPLVEPAGWGHFFIDATGTGRLWGTLLDTAESLRRLVNQELQLDAAVGLASNKLVSRVASRVVRLRELCDVFPGAEARFLAPLRLDLLPGIGEVTRSRMLAELNLRTIGELAAVPPPFLNEVFGGAGQRLRRMALGEDTSPVLAPRAASSLRQEIRLPEDDNDRARLLGQIYRLVEALGRQLRSQNRCPSELALTVTYADGLQAKARERFAAPGCEFHLDSVLYTVASRLFARAGRRRLRIRHLTVTAARLQPPIGQLALFPWDDLGRRREIKLLQALDQIRHRYGEQAVYYGKLVITGNGEGRRG